MSGQTARVVTSDREFVNAIIDSARFSIDVGNPLTLVLTKCPKPLRYLR